MSLFGGNLSHQIRQTGWTDNEPIWRKSLTGLDEHAGLIMILYGNYLSMIISLPGGSLSHQIRKKGLTDNEHIWGVFLIRLDRQDGLILSLDILTDRMD